ncbi:MAG: hypothetical protein ABRQ26_15300 [Syntrophomonadaceae bacterium]
MPKDECYWWPNYFFCKGEEFNQFWQDFFEIKPRKLLFILGMGFDQRMNLGLKNIISSIKDSSVQCLLLNFNEGELSPSNDYKDMIINNYNELKGLLRPEYINEVNIKMIDDNRRVGGRIVANLFKDISSIEAFTDIVIDISALPRNIYFPMLVQILDINKTNPLQNGKRRNIHVVVAESSQIDSKIIEQELDEKADYIFLLSGEMKKTSKANKPIVWFPVLGQNRGEQLSRVLELLESSSTYNSFLDLEICPVMPFPSKEPRMPDFLISTYREPFFSSTGIEARNILYCDEQNPFDIYRQIMESGFRYDKALNLIDGCRKVVSTMSSKLISLGALLAAYEGNMAVAYTGAQGYRINGLIDEHSPVDLFEVWLDGEPYE